MAPLSTWLLASRPKTLPAAAAPVLVGTAMAFEAGGAHWFSAVCCLLGAVFIQIGTNFHNDVADFEKGSDTAARRGPVRATASGLVSASAMKRATVAAFGLAILAGGYLMWRGGLPIVIIGVLSILSGILYTAGDRSLASLGLADLFVLVFFGPVAVGGTYYVQTLAITPAVLLAGFAPGILAVAILLINNIRDVDEDRDSGKRTLVVRLGRPWGVRLYGVCIILAAAIPVTLVLMQPAKMWTVLALLALVPAVGVLRRVSRETEGVMLNPMLARTAQVLLLYSILFTVGWNI